MTGLLTAIKRRFKRQHPGLAVYHRASRSLGRYVRLSQSEYCDLRDYLDQCERMVMPTARGITLNGVEVYC